MSLLLDARKKTQDAPGADGGRAVPAPGMETNPQAASSQQVTSPPPGRMAGQILFGAKSGNPAPETFAGINRKLLYALGGTVILLAAGGGYVWYVTSASNNPPLHPVARPPAAPPVAQQPPVIAEAPPKIASVPAVAPSRPAGGKRPIRRPLAKAPPQTQSETPPRIEQHLSEPIDPLLNSAYKAYREGKFDLAQQLYREAHKLDTRNTDALLGLAVIAQRRGADSMAAHYYAKVLELNPRDPVANAGMSALVPSDNVESRLKALLGEQQDSSSLHFALGNFYASQERWGEAQQAYFNAYKLEPENAGLAFHLAISLERIGKNKMAAQYYRSALQLDVSRSEGFDHEKISRRIEELNH